jgi:hypothetical protein
MLLAQASEWTAPVGIASAVGIGVFLLIAFNQAAKAWRNLKGEEPHPPNSQLDVSVRDLERRVTLAEGATVGIQAEMRKEHDTLRAKQEADNKANEIHISQRSKSIYDEINRCREGLEGKIQAVEDAFTTHSKDIERALGRIEGKLENRRH